MTVTTTPNAPNGVSGRSGFAPDVVFSVSSRTFVSPFSVTLSTATTTTNAVIRYILITNAALASASITNVPTTNSPIYTGHRPNADAATIGTLRAAGALILGKTDTMEFASTGRLAATATRTISRGPPGGSSSGSAAAVGDFHVPLALGTQTGGSLIRPGSFCGVYAMKPTWNAVSAEELKSLGETEFITGVAAMSASGKYGPTKCMAGITGYVDLRLGSRAKGVIERHIAVSDGRLKAIRNGSTWSDDPVLKPMSSGMLLDKTFREGIATLAGFNLAFDAWMFLKIRSPTASETRRATKISRSRWVSWS